MPKLLHASGGVAALCLVATFLTATAVSELVGDAGQIARVKALIVAPGLFLLVPSLMLAGGAGNALAKERRGRLVAAKSMRMKIVAALGIIVLLPSAIVLSQLAAAGRFDGLFYGVQAAEIAAGSMNLALLALNLRDGLRMSSRRGTRSASSPPASPAAG